MVTFGFRSSLAISARLIFNLFDRLLFCVGVLRRECEAGCGVGLADLVYLRGRVEVLVSIPISGRGGRGAGWRLRLLLLFGENFSSRDVVENAFCRRGSLMFVD